MPPMRKLILIIGVCLALVVAGCGSDDSTTPSSSSEESSSSKEAEAPGKKTKPKVEKPSGDPPKELVTKDLEEGSGAEAKAGDAVSVNYVGVNYKTGKEFDALVPARNHFAGAEGERERFALVPGGTVHVHPRRRRSDSGLGPGRRRDEGR